MERHKGCERSRFHRVRGRGTWNAGKCTNFTLLFVITKILFHKKDLQRDRQRCTAHVVPSPLFHAVGGWSGGSGHPPVWLPGPVGVGVPMSRSQVWWGPPIQVPGLGGKGFPIQVPESEGGSRVPLFSPRSGVGGRPVQSQDPWYRTPPPC